MIGHGGAAHVLVCVVRVYCVRAGWKRKFICIWFEMSVGFFIFANVLAVRFGSI